MDGHIKFKKLLEPGYIGSVKTKNRLVRAGANPGFPGDYDDGYLQPYYYNFYEALAQGGIGLLTIGASPIGAPPGKGYRLDDDKYIPGLHKFTDTIHQYHCPVFMQMFHIGPWMPGEFSAAASTLTEAEMPITTQSLPNAHSLTIPEIKNVVRKFVEMAERAHQAGFDGVEINAGCTHLFSTFLSRAWNRRQDEYGPQSIVNRTRIVVEVIREIRRRNGRDFAIVALLNAVEPGLENGITQAEGLEIAQAFEAAGADAIIPRVEFFNTHKATGKKDSTHFPDVALYPEAPAYAAANSVDIKHHGVGGWVPLAAALKKTVQIPVITVGRLDAQTGEEILKQGHADFISLNRRLIADHDYPDKIFAGKFEDIAPCTACQTCFNDGEAGNFVRCRINAAAFKEKEYALKPAAPGKKVVVIGGGPAGMEAARVAALRGHKVTLIEKEPDVGGAMNLAAVIKGSDREDLPGMIDYLKTQIVKAGVDILLGHEADRKLVESFQPDAVVVAIGGIHDIPRIPGIEKSNVLTGQALHHQLQNYLNLTGVRIMTKLAAHYISIGKSIIIIGGHIQGCQTAEFLVKRGRQVTIVETGPEIGAGFMPFQIKPQLIDWLDKKDVPMLTGVTIEAVTDHGLNIIDKSGQRQTLEADAVLTALPLLPNRELYNQLKDVVPEVHCIGDCRQPGLIIDAIADGSRIAREI